MRLREAPVWYCTDGSRGPSGECTLVSSKTSRTAVSMTCSPGSHLPLGSNQSSYLGRCTSRTAPPGAPAPPPSPSGGPAVGRHTTAPAAKMTSVISRTDPPLPDQGLLHVDR